MMRLPIYLDHQATTPVDPRVLDAMLPYFTEHYGNPSSRRHRFGRLAREAVEAARCGVARGLGARPEEIIFTSGATEANNLVIRGVCESSASRTHASSHYVSVVTEHHAVLEPLAAVRRRGNTLTLLHVAPHGSPRAGILSPADAATAIREETVLVSVMLANNVIGAIQPLRELGLICREKGILLHTDATQAAGKLPIQVDDLQVDYLSLSAHKMYGPKGIGALYVRKGRARAALTPQMDGGSQEGGLRGGTLNVPAIVGLGRAFDLSLEAMPEETGRIRTLRNRMADELQRQVPGCVVVGPSLDHADLRLAGNLNCLFPGVSSTQLIAQLGETLAISNGAACMAEDEEPSHVLVFLQLDNEAARACVRFGFGRFNTEEEVSAAVGLLTEALTRIRERPARRKTAA